MREPKFILTIIVVIIVTATVVPLILYYNDMQEDKKRAQVTTNTASSYDANHVLYIDRSTVLLSNGKPKKEVASKPAIENNTFGIKKDKVENIVQNTSEEKVEKAIDVFNLPKEEYGFEGKIISEDYIDSLAEDSRSFLIKNYDGLKLFASDYGLEKIVDLYTSNTFDYKNLAIRYVPCIEGENEFSFYSVIEENNVLYVDYASNFYKESPLSKKGYLLVFEVNKNVTEITKK